MTIYRRNPLLMTVMGANPGRSARRRDDPVDKAIGEAWHRLMSGIQVSVMDIPRIFRDVKLEVAGGMSIEEAVMRVGARFQVNRNPRYRRNPSLAASLAGGIAGAFVTHAMSNPYHGSKHATPVSWQIRKTELREGAFWTLFLVIHAPYVRGGKYSPRSNRKVLDVMGKFGGEEEAREFIRRSEYPNLPIDVYIESYDEFMAWGDRVSRKYGLNPRKSSTKKIRRANPQANPGPKGGRRKITMTVQQFAAWVKKKRDPAMWRAFLAKFRGYEKWTHGAKSRKVTLEWQNVPGMDGLWITYDGGKQPESTYIMPKGSKRKGAWKHPWDTMPDIKHDPESKIVLTKLRGKSKITDFLHH